MKNTMQDNVLELPGCGFIKKIDTKYDLVKSHVDYLNEVFLTWFHFFQLAKTIEDKEKFLKHMHETTAELNNYLEIIKKEQ